MAENTIYVKDCISESGMYANPFLEPPTGFEDMVMPIIIPTENGTTTRTLSADDMYRLYCTYYKPYREIALPTVQSFQYEWAEIYRNNVNKYAEILRVESIRICSDLTKSTEELLKQPTYTREYNSSGNDNNVYSDTPNTSIPTRTETGFATSLDNTEYEKTTGETFNENPLKTARDFLERLPSFIKQFVGLFDDLLYDCYVVKQNLLNRKDWL